MGDWAEKFAKSLSLKHDAHEVLRLKIRDALRKARADALEEAAVIAERMSDRLNVDDGGIACMQVADEIRALKEVNRG